MGKLNLPRKLSYTQRLYRTWEASVLGKKPEAETTEKPTEKSVERRDKLAESKTTVLKQEKINLPRKLNYTQRLYRTWENSVLGKKPEAKTTEKSTDKSVDSRN